MGSSSAVKKGTDMCQDLLNTVFDEFQGKGGIVKGRGKILGRNKESGKGEGKSKGKGKEGKGKSKTYMHDGAEFKECIPVDSEGVHRGYYLRARLVGQDGQNVKHVERSTDTRITVSHDDGNGMSFTISGDDKSGVDQAVEMCQDLIDTIVAEGREKSQANDDVAEVEDERAPEIGEADNFEVFQEAED